MAGPDSDWSPDQYLRFADHRLRPALELLQRIGVGAAETVYDLGCGPGQVTKLLAERWPDARVCGVDHSEAMLARARAAHPNLAFTCGDLTHWVPDAPADVLYSNAALHWAPNHQRLLPRLIGALRPGGCLAVQMPRSWSQPSHQLMRETLARGGPDGGPLGTEGLRQALAEPPVLGPGDYFELLAGRAAALDIWETEYQQVLEGEDAVLEWVRGTGLRPILQALDGAALDQFMTRYRQALRAAYPPAADGRTLYPFRRLFLVATVHR
ncbi:MAG: methyltransferase domain-containing protein [Planctomycetota bacterium]